MVDFSGNDVDVVVDVVLVVIVVGVGVVNRIIVATSFSMWSTAVLPTDTKLALDS